MINNFAIISRDILKQERMAVACEGELVVVHLGNVEVKIPYEAAFKLSQWIRIRAKEAKRRAGDNARHWSAIGVVTDANVTRG